MNSEGGNGQPYDGRREPGIAEHERVAVPSLPVSERHAGFAEVELGCDPEQVTAEARRCLQCDLRLHMRGNPAPPVKALPYDAEHIGQIPETEGVFQLFDGKRQVLAIKGTANLRQELLAALDANSKAAWFEFEEEKLYSKRESELLQRYLQQHGRMPAGGDELDDLFQ